MPTGTLSVREDPDFTGQALTADTTLYRADSTILTADLTRIGGWTVTVAWTGVLNATEGSDVATFLGVELSGEIAATEASDTSAIVGVVLAVLPGLITAREGPDLALFNGTVGDVVAPVIAPPKRIIDAGGGYGSRTVARTRDRQPTMQRLSRKEMELLIAALPEADQKELLQNVDDEDIVFLLENS
jgi:hypothetical protein